MIEVVNLSVNQGASRTDNFQLVDTRSGSPVVVPADDVVSIVIELRASPDRSTEILETLTLARSGDFYPITIPTAFTTANAGNIYGDIKFTLTEGLTDYAARLNYKIGNTTTV